MQRRRTDGAHAGRRAWVSESITPLGAACVWAVVSAGHALWAPQSHVAGLLASVTQAVLAVLTLHALHEGGHVLAGLIVGVPLQSVTLGLLTLRRERRGGDGRFRWDVNRSWQRFAGCVEREVDPAPGLREALTATALGGPVASAVGGALLLAAPEPWVGVGMASLVVGLLNALPIRVLGQASDGMIVRRLWSRRPADVAWRTEICGADATPAGVTIRR